MLSVSGGHKLHSCPLPVRILAPHFSTAFRATRKMPARANCLDVSKLAFPIQLQILLMNPKLSLWPVQTQFVTAPSIKSGEQAVRLLSLKRARTGPRMDASSHSINVHTAANQPCTLGPQELLT